MQKSELLNPGVHILFSPSFFYRLDEKQWKDRKPYPPYGTLNAAAWMRTNGFTIDLFDTHLRKSTAELIPVLGASNPKYFVLYDDGFNYLTKMCLTTMRSAAFKLMEYAMKANCKVIVCTSDATDHIELYLDKGANYVILGEGEITLLELIKSLDAEEENPIQIQGIAYKHSEKLIKTSPRPVLKDLDTLPDPAWDLIHMDAYRNIWKASHGYFSLNIATTRGCPFKCNWCAKPIYGNRYNSRSPQRVVAELNYLQQQYEVDHFWMADDIFGLNPKWVERFQQEVEQVDLKIKYKIQSRADLLLQDNYIKALIHSGIDEVWIGAESGSQKILDAMDKGTTVLQIHQATKILQSKGIKVGFFLQFGYPGEEMTEIKETIHLMLELMPDDIGISISYPLPGTVFYERVKNQLRSKQNWIDSDDLDLLYAAAYTPAFYKQLHRFVHKIFRLKQGWKNLRDLVQWHGKFNRAAMRSVLSLLYYIPATLSDRIRLYRLVSS